MTDPYMDALDHFEELLDNAQSNDGGIHWGKDFLKGAHWDFELRDQLNQLRDARHQALFPTERHRKV